MNPVALIKKELGPTEWSRACSAWREPSIVEIDEALCFFSEYKTYIVRGATDQFDFPMLPHSSYGYFAANGRQAIHLTREGKEIEQLLAADWNALPQANPVRLASFILRFYDAGILANHSVLQDVDTLTAMCQAPRAFRLNAAAIEGVRAKIGVTSLRQDEDALILRAVTLLGWMHMKANLGIEHIQIARDGRVTLEPRLVLTEKAFEKFPPIMY